MRRLFIAAFIMGLIPFLAHSQTNNFDYLDIFELEYAGDPQLSRMEEVWFDEHIY